ncbi:MULTISPECIES: hypothetical protein [Sulfurisphaera]|uniref:Uncharacterized protein n=3 Tax=Sulfurisphaera TaxID=69655 RepID=F9VMN0_SULTO|nr:MULTISPECIES: hypothetical protein [Sulfurisphaera]MBB5253285.1 hypothetical protein [Sulfurisphaera ohwakuensis]BAK54176.1 hypothetical protein STK_01785 [Sulfurisphaera tokodaii str. 7]HII74294.1 hypothetical protein [Sulfurisphaera tokodaii]
MSQLEEAIKRLEEVEEIIKNIEINDEDKEYVEKILLKNMNIEAEIYTKYLRRNK